MPASYAKAAGEWAVLVDICKRLTDKSIPTSEQLTHAQVKDLCARGKLGNLKHGTIQNYIYGAKDPKDSSRYSIEPGSWKTLSDFKSRLPDWLETTMLLSLAAEEMLLNIAVRCVRLRHGLGRHTIMQFARKLISAEKPAPYEGSLRRWYEGFEARAKRLFGISLEKQETQQQSAGRASLSRQTVAEFKEVVDAFLDQLKREGKHLTLNHIANADEAWLDINKLLQGDVVAIDGEKAFSQTPSEHSPHVTIYGGAFGFETSPAERAVARAETVRAAAAAELERVLRLSESEPASEHTESLAAARSALAAIEQALPALKAQAAGDQRVARPTFLDEWLKKRSSTCDLDEDKLGYLNSLSLETWNSDYFRIYPLLIIFPAATVDPGWLSLCKSKYVMVAATEDGWMNEETKVSWFKKCIELGFPPFAGGQSIINQSDGHYSNLSLELLQLQKQYGVDTLITPGHHTAVLQQADQRGGPIHLTNMILRSLLLKERMRYPGQNIPKVRAEADAPHMAQLEMLMCTILSARCRHSNYMHAYAIPCVPFDLLCAECVGACRRNGGRCIVHSVDVLGCHHARRLG